MPRGSSLDSRGRRRCDRRRGSAPSNRAKVTREPRAEIEEIVHRETRAWDEKDVELLLSIFHPDMVWPWPPDPAAHDPESWIMPFGRFNAVRWRNHWEE